MSMKASAQFVAALVACTATTLPAFGEEGWITLFDGTSLTGWQTSKGEPVTAGWVAENGQLHQRRRHFQHRNLQGFRTAV